MSFKSLMGADSFALRDTSGNVKMTLTGKAYDIFDTLEIRVSAPGSDGGAGGAVLPSDPAVATVRRDRGKVAGAASTFSLFQGGQSAGAWQPKSGCSSLCSCCVHTEHADGASTSTDAAENLVGTLKKAWFLPIYRYYTFDREAGSLSKRPSLVAEGNYAGTTFVIMNRKREVCARISRKLLQRDTNNVYTIDVAAGVDVAVVVAIVTSIDEIAEDD